MDPFYPFNTFRTVPKKYDPIGAENIRIFKMNQRQRDILQQEILQRHRLNRLVNDNFDEQLSNKYYHAKARRKINHALLYKLSPRIVLPSTYDVLGAVPNHIDDYAITINAYNKPSNFGSKRASKLTLPQLRADLRNL